MPSSASHGLIGQTAPSFHQSEVTIPVGKPTVLIFWASWCPTCRALMPQFQEIWEDLDHKEVSFVGVSMDENKGSALEWMNNWKLTFPNTVDSKADVSDLYRIGSIPLAFVLDKDGVVQWVGHDPTLTKQALRFLTK